MVIPSKTHTKEKYIIFLFALTTFLLHFFVNLSGAYGYFRDELYYIACSEHLAWGYVDHPPLSIYILKLSRLVFGESLVAIRIVPALCISATLIFTGLIAREMGAALKGISIACFALSLSIIHIAFGGFYNMNPIDLLIWSIAFYIVVRLIKTKKPHLWIYLGFVLGLGLLNKISVLFLGAGIGVGLILTEERKWLATRWPYLCGCIAIVIFLPYVIWNINHDLAHLEFIKNASGQKYASRDRSDFISEIILLLNPINFPIWVSGLLALIFYNKLKTFRFLGWVFITVFLILIFNKTSKGEYLAAAVSILFASAGVYFEQFFKRPVLRFIVYAYLVILFLVSALVVPAALPIMPVENFISYSKAIGLSPTSNEKKEMGELSQFYADMFGWEDKASDVAKVYNSLSPSDKEKCAIYSSNYGRCGAIDFFGKKYGLPAAIGNHNNYWIWGPRNYTGEVMIILGGSMEDHADDFESCELAGASDCDYCMPYEDNLNIFLCRGLKKPLKEVWNEEKHYD